MLVISRNVTELFLLSGHGHKNIIRSIKKENKLYFYDWSNVPDNGCRFENLLAVSLIKMAARMTEIGLGTYEIIHIRNKEKQEADFALVKNNRPVALFEAKESGCDISKAGLYFSKQLSLPYFQIVRNCQIAGYPIKALGYDKISCMMAL